jgi:hypothetical protein
VSELTLPPLKKRGKGSKTRTKKQTGDTRQARGTGEGEETVGEEEEGEGRGGGDMGGDAAWYRPRTVEFWPGGRLKGPEFEVRVRVACVLYVRVAHIVPCV